MTESDTCRELVTPKLATLERVFLTEAPAHA
jgi:hypothetical protein